MTAYWVELSEEAGRPVRELGHKRVTCAPLPHALPLPGMARVRCVGLGVEHPPPKHCQKGHQGPDATADACSLHTRPGLTDFSQRSLAMHSTAVCLQ